MKSNRSTSENSVTVAMGTSEGFVIILPPCSLASRILTHVYWNCTG